MIFFLVAFFETERQIVVFFLLFCFVLLCLLLLKHECFRRCTSDEISLWEAFVS